MKKKIFFIKKIILPLVFFVVSSFLSFSISGLISDRNIEYFEKSFEAHSTILYENRFIFGQKSNLGKSNYISKEFKEIENNGPINYGVCLKSGTFLEGLDSEFTPIESYLLRYEWSDNAQTNRLIQQISFTKISDDVDFDAKLNKIVLSSDNYEALGSPKTLKIYSPIIGDFIECGVAGYYKNPNPTGRSILNMFCLSYKNPLFLNWTAFKSFYGGQEDFDSNIQADTILPKSSNYSTCMYNVFKNKNWKNNIHNYLNFSEIFENMSSYKNNDTFLLVVILLLSFVGTVCLILIPAILKKDLKSALDLLDIRIEFKVLFSLFGMLLIYGLGFIFNISLFSNKSCFGYAAVFNAAIILFAEILVFMKKELSKRNEK